MNNQRPNLIRIFTLSLAHMLCDLTQGAIPVLLPFFMAEHQINYAAAAMIVFASNIVSTISQPLLGLVSDRWSKPWLVPIGVLLAGLGFSCSGMAPSYSLILLAIAISGLGVAAFHPEGARQAYRIAGDKKATMMSLFTLGGQVGFALAPIIATALLLRTGLRGTFYFALPGLLIAIFLLVRSHRLFQLQETTHPDSESRGPSKDTDHWGAFYCLSTVAICRSVVFYGLITFLPLYWLNVLNQSTVASGTALTVLVTCSMIGNLLGGRIADRFGYRIAALIEFALLASFMPLLPLTSNVGLATLLLVPIGSLLSAPTSSIVVLGQSYLPNHIGFSSGVTMGLGFSFGGIVTPLLGWVGDQYGLPVTMMTVALFPIICMGLMLLLPKTT